MGPYSKFLSAISILIWGLTFSNVGHATITYTISGYSNRVATSSTVTTGSAVTYNYYVSNMSNFAASTNCDKTRNTSCRNPSDILTVSASSNAKLTGSPQMYILLAPNPQQGIHWPVRALSHKPATPAVRPLSVQPQ